MQYFSHPAAKACTTDCWTGTKASIMPDIVTEICLLCSYPFELLPVRLLEFKSSVSLVGFFFSFLYVLPVYKEILRPYHCCTCSPQKKNQRKSTYVRITTPASAYRPTVRQSTSVIIVNHLCQKKCK